MLSSFPPPEVASFFFFFLFLFFLPLLTPQPALVRGFLIVSNHPLGLAHHVHDIASQNKEQARLPSARAHDHYVDPHKVMIENKELEQLAKLTNCTVLINVEFYVNIHFSKDE